MYMHHFFLLNLIVQQEKLVQIHVYTELDFQNFIALEEKNENSMAKNKTLNICKK